MVIARFPAASVERIEQLRISVNLVFAGKPVFACNNVMLLERTVAPSLVKTARTRAADPPFSVTNVLLSEYAINDVAEEYLLSMLIEVLLMKLSLLIILYKGVPGS